MPWAARWSARWSSLVTLDLDFTTRSFPLTSSAMTFLALSALFTSSTLKPFARRVAMASDRRRSSPTVASFVRLSLSLRACRSGMRPAFSRCRSSIVLKDLRIPSRDSRSPTAFLTRSLSSM